MQIAGTCLSIWDDFWFTTHRGENRIARCARVVNPTVILRMLRLCAQSKNISTQILVNEAHFFMICNCLHSFTVASSKNLCRPQPFLELFSSLHSCVPVKAQITNLCWTTSPLKVSLNWYWKSEKEKEHKLNKHWGVNTDKKTYLPIKLLNW